MVLEAQGETQFALFGEGRYQLPMLSSNLAYHALEISGFRSTRSRAIAGEILESNGSKSHRVMPLTHVAASLVIAGLPSPSQSRGQHKCNVKELTSPITPPLAVAPRFSRAKIKCALDERESGDWIDW